MRGQAEGLSATVAPDDRLQCLAGLATGTVRMPCSVKEDGVTSAVNACIHYSKGLAFPGHEDEVVSWAWSAC